MSCVGSVVVRDGVVHPLPLLVPRYPLTQSALLVAGILGIVVYKEVRGAKRIGCFVGSGCIVVCGAVLLGSYGSCESS